jgi:parvulin-like peptidyl-prolyl isomerase
MKKKLTKLDYAVIALGAVLLAGLVVLGIFMLKDSQRQKELEPSADYYGWTVLEAMYAECEVRGLSITAEEMVALEAQAKEDVRQYALAGEEVSYEDCLEEAKFEFLFERLRTTLPLADNITKDDVQQWYDIRLEALNNAFAQEPGVFKSQQDQFDKHGGVEPLVVPEGYVYVRHILLEDLETAQLVLEKLNAGGDFVELMHRYGKDDSVYAHPYATVGYLVGPYESKVDYLQEFKDAALALQQIGDYSGIVQTKSGYEIIQLVSRLEAGTKPLEQVYDQIHRILLKNDQTEQLTQLLKDWVS